MSRSLRHLSFLFALGFLAGTTVTGGGAAMLGSAVFRDVPVGSFYDEAVGDMYGAGIIKGMDATRFDPNGYVTRGQVAVLMQRLRNDLRGVSIDPPPPPPPADDGASSSATSRARRSSSSKSSSASSASSSADPAAGVIGFNVEAFSVSERAAKTSVAVMRTGGSKGQVTVMFKTENGTTDENDLVAGGGKVTFAAGETIKTINISLKDDLVGEGNETFDIILSDPQGGAALGKSKATVTILDNESPGAGSSSSASSTSSVTSAGSFGFSAVTYGWQEDAGPITITVTRAGGTKGAVTVNYATSDGSGKNGTDYTSTSGTLSFADGEATKTFTVQIADNTNIDGNRNLNLALSNAAGGAGLSAERTAVLTIIDNETIPAAEGNVLFSLSNYDGLRSQDTLVTVKRMNGNTGTISVNYSAADGTSVAGSDFKATSGTLTFAPGETSKVFRVYIYPGARAERTVNLTLTPGSSNPAQLGTPSSAIITIFN